MRVVIYDDETMEPITVISLPGVGERDILDNMNGIVRLAPMPQYSGFSRERIPPERPRLDVVELRFERFVRNGQTALMCFTREAELALLLASDFLPGQRGYVQALEKNKDALTRLVLAALEGH